jgi:heat shock protein HtpX
MAAYGLYTHIASNKVRSMLLLGGLFLLVYVMIFAGALLAEVALNSNRPFDAYLTLAGAISSRRFRSPPSALPHGS